MQGSLLIMLILQRSVTQFFALPHQRTLIELFVVGASWICQSRNGLIVVVVRHLLRFLKQIWSISAQLFLSSSWLASLLDRNSDRVVCACSSSRAIIDHIVWVCRVGDRRVWTTH